MNQRTGGKLSPTTINRYHRFVSIVLAQAVREQIIHANVATLAEPPRKAKTTPNCVAPEEYPAILTALETEPEKWRMAITLLIATGCRRGELFGLRWQNIDLDRQIIHICNETMYSPGNGLYETTPKSQTSDRYLDIDAALAAELRAYKAHQAAEILEYGAAYQRRDFVFAQPDGSPMHPDSLNTWLSRFCKRHGLASESAQFSPWKCDVPHFRGHRRCDSFAPRRTFKAIHDGKHLCASARKAQPRMCRTHRSGNEKTGLKQSKPRLS